MIRCSSIRSLFLLCLLLALLPGLAPTSTLSAAETDASANEALASRAKEVFRVRCHECHGGAAAFEPMFTKPRLRVRSQLHGQAHGIIHTCGHHSAMRS